MALTDYQIRQIIQMRGIGYTQQEIADRIGVSRKSVENRLRRLRAEGEDVEENEGGIENLFWGTLLTLGAAAVLAAVLNNQQRGDGNR